eukprot:TRINITY_DN5220_c0_g2_i1.p1 TRINITY_DN5220_c0_g2~~TRINITY_DN5220_c0_g2_i1.p1  ORF type:complete len:171 (+),score=37.37 TRINITY_DN5220_c0_g2_i1:70-582(+)
MGQACCSEEKLTAFESITASPSVAIGLATLSETRSEPVEATAPEVEEQEAEPLAPPPPPTEVEEPKPAPISTPAAAATEEETKQEGVPILFQLDDGKTKEIVFTYRPLGIDLTTDGPLRVKRVHPNTVADQMGVKPAWSILKICGEPITANNFETKEKIKQVVRSLPLKP